MHAAGVVSDASVTWPVCVGGTVHHRLTPVASNSFIGVASDRAGTWPKLHGLGCKQRLPWPQRRPRECSRVHFKWVTRCWLVDWLFELTIGLSNLSANNVRQIISTRFGSRILTMWFPWPSKGTCINASIWTFATCHLQLTLRVTRALMHYDKYDILLSVFPLSIFFPFTGIFQAISVKY